MSKSKNDWYFNGKFVKTEYKPMSKPKNGKEYYHNVTLPTTADVLSRIKPLNKGTISN